jgi:hypothetical protein
VSTGAFSGSIGIVPAGRVNAPFRFLGPTAQVATATGQRITATASGVIGTHTAGNPQTDVIICRQATTGGDLTTVGIFLTFSLISGLPQLVSAAGSAVPGAGTWQVGLCGRGDAALDFNDFVSGWVQVTN